MRTTTRTRTRTRTATARIATTTTRANRAKRVTMAKTTSATAVQKIGVATSGLPSSATRREFSPFMYVAGAVGIAGLGVGVVTGIMASGKHSEAEELCEDQKCVSGSSGPDTVNDFRKLRTVSTFSYGIGAAGIAAGVVFWLTADTSPATEQAASTSVEPWLTPETAGIRGTF